MTMSAATISFVFAAISLTLDLCDSSTAISSYAGITLELAGYVFSSTKLITGAQILYHCANDFTLALKLKSKLIAHCRITASPIEVRSNTSSYLLRWIQILFKLRAQQMLE